MDYTLRIGGAAGQGIQTVGGLLSEVFARMGFHVFTSQDYESRVRGGHNFYQVRLSDTRVMSSTETIDILIALDLASEEFHRGSLSKNGVMLYDSETLKKTFEGTQMLDLPFARLAKEAGGPIMANTVAVGAALGALGMDLPMMETLLAERFGKKGAEVVAGNKKALGLGHAYATDNCKRCEFTPGEIGARKLLINGLEAAAAGALASGLKFYSAYPMTPSTGIMDNIAKRASEFGVVVEQAEDEIAAINMALGASFAGVRSATGSSGGGFALMVEGLSLAGITETPIVIFEAQRPGPATGLPTRTEQADLMFVLHSAHGEFPRVVLAPGSPEQCVLLTNKAFDLAEKYQIPVFVLLDQYLGDSQWTYEGFNTDAITYTDYRIRGEEARNIKDYKRYAITESGISPLLVPGDGHTHLVIADSDEHDEDGHLIED
ncbi:MAG: 2-oxoacid:acceptor oxidoreductase subunit alpha, partial [Thermodesulfovibrionales bacterium]|nr:2-oxoacid:acceptor oxidoreductase subunit alpha [Thermodesulfovibrionales bacterium]